MTRRKRKSSNLFILLIFVAVLMMIVSFSFFRQPVTQEDTPGGTPEGENFTEEHANCGDLQIDINSIKEAVSYTRSNLVKPAVQDFKFVILNLTVTNKGDLSKDFSGHRLRLAADGNNYSSLYFSKMDEISLLDGSTINYSCVENKLASISRLVLGVEESESGCKIFQITETLVPSSLSVYQMESLKCVIQL